MGERAAAHSERRWPDGGAMSITRRLMMAAGAASAPLETAVLAAVGTANTTAATIDTASATFAVGDRLIACLSHRRNATNRTHDSITSAGWTATWTKRPDQFQDDTVQVTSHRASMWDGVVTAAGTGAATGTLSGDAYSRALIILRVPGMTAVDRQAAASNEVGTTIDAAWSVTPNAAALGIAFMASEGTGATLAVTGLTAIADTALAPASGHQVRCFQKLASLPDPLAGTGATNDTAKILVGLSVVGA